MNRDITLISMGSGNVIALGETLRSFKNICSEIIYGDMILFNEDREILGIYEKEYNFKIVPLPFDYIFKNGFSECLNTLSDKSTNNLCLYMNTSEIIDENYNINEIINKNTDCNTFFFTHRTELHRWFRCYDRLDLRWSGKIHEEVTGDHRPYHKPIFMMADLEKDMYNSFKAAVFNDFKEINYFTQYMKLIDEPEGIGATNPGWINFAKDNYESMRYRLYKKGARYEAVKNGSLYDYLAECYKTPDFESQRFESNDGIEYQGDPKYLNK